MRPFGPSQPFQPWDREYGLRFYGGGDIGLVGAAAIYAASAVASWAQALLVPGVQAAANITLLNHQKNQYDNIATTQRQFLTTAINNYVNGVESLLPTYEDAFPEVPQAAEYQPVDSCCVQGATIECNISHIERAGVYSSAVNRYKEQEAIVRSVIFDPNFLVGMDLHSVQLRDLMRGILPVGNVVDILSNRAEQDALNGNIGNCRKTTARDLGLGKLAVQAAGRAEHRDHHRFIGTAVHPIGQVSNIEDLMQTPQQRIALALTQAQLIQNSLQNLYNRNAQKSPYLMAQLETKIQRLINRLQFEASKATLTNTFVPNYAAVLAPTVQKIAGAIGDTIETPSKNMFFGAPGTQDGFTTQRSSSTVERAGDPYEEAQRPSGTPRGFGF